MVTFDKSLLKELRRHAKAFVCTYEGPYILGHDEPDYCTGDYIDVYYSNWDYEEADVLRSNEDLKKCVEECLKQEIEIWIDCWNDLNELKATVSPMCKIDMDKLIEEVRSSME